VWPICHDLRERREVREDDLHGVGVDRDPLHEALDHGPLLPETHGEPVLGKVPGAADDVVLHDRFHLEKVDLPLEAGDLASHAREALFERPVPLAEAIDGQSILLVEAVELLGFLHEALPLPEKGAQEFFLLFHRFASLSEVLGDGLGREGELLQLVLE